MAEIGGLAVAYVREAAGAAPAAEQHAAIEALAARHGWRLARWFADGADGPRRRKGERPGLRELVEALSGGRFDVVVVASLDRLGRSLADLLRVLMALHGTGVGLATCEPVREPVAWAPILAAAEAMLAAHNIYSRERGLRGVVGARARRVRIGRPPLSAERESTIRAALGRGAGIMKVAAQLHAGRGTVQRIARQMRAEAAAEARLHARQEEVLARMKAEAAADRRQMVEIAVEKAPPAEPRPILELVEEELARGRLSRGKG